MSTPSTERRSVFRRKPVEAFVSETAPDAEDGELSRSIGLFQLTMFGVGATIGTASTNTEKAEVPLPDKVVTRKNSRRTREIVTTPSSAKEFARAVSSGPERARSAIWCLTPPRARAARNGVRPSHDPRAQGRRLRSTIGLRLPAIAARHSGCQKVLARQHSYLPFANHHPRSLMP